MWGVGPVGKTRTSSFGTSKREGHDASIFYARGLYGEGTPPLEFKGLEIQPAQSQEVAPEPLSRWADRIYCHTAEEMGHVPDSSVGLAFTSPPYNVGKDFDGDVALVDYLALIGRVAREVRRILVPGGRYVVNVANLGRNPYIPLHAYFYAVHGAAGFFPVGEVIWRKSKGMNGNCAWGSWRSAAAPRLRDVHEYLLVFAKDAASRSDKGESDITADEFMASTLSVWEIPPESAKRVGHPAPFPVPLAERVIRLFSYAGDVVLDPFAGSGTTCVAAKMLGRHFVGYDIDPTYCDLAKERIASTDLGVARSSG